MLISLKNLEECEARYNAWQKIKKSDTILESTGPVPSDDIPAPEILKKRKQMLRAGGLEPLNFAFERAIGNNDSVYSNFVEILADAKKKVGRIVLKSGPGIRGYATGFMVSERLLLTNWHVFKKSSEVLDSEVQFNYEYDSAGRPKTPIVFRFKPEDFFYAFEDLDYCLVAVQSIDIQSNIPLSNIGYLFLNPELGKLANEGQEFVNVIHHPNGDYMQLSIRENKFVKIQENTLWYKADTSPGSSGSPVFNDQFQVVALHHMGVAKKTADGQFYVDSKGEKIMPENGKIDLSRVQWIANEGIRISKLMQDITARFPDNEFVNGLKIPATLSQESDNAFSRPEFQIQSEQAPSGEPAPGESIQLSIPVSVLQAQGILQISLRDAAVVTPAGNNRPPAVGVNGSELDMEIAKLAQEQAQDYSGCQGYDPAFMGQKLPFPRPGKSLLPFIARLKNSQETELKYHHYSAIQHALRKMPLISGINVDGDPAKRQDSSERKDIWLRDNRIDLEAQLTDKYYALSGFDKGHMSRREDANWGDTAEDARIAANFTCLYTNACPQVGKLNRTSGNGLWGKLERTILEKGVADERGNAAKIVVFNGPVFSENDPVYKGIQVPLEFWKLVVWRNAKKHLRATAFKLSQVNLVDNINFEDLNFDQVMDFQEYQLSIKSLEKLIDIDFSAYRKYDTFGKDQNKKPVKLDNLESLIL